MAIDRELKRLADHRDETRRKIDELTEAGTGNVSDGDMSYQAIDLDSHRREERRASAALNRYLVLRGGFSILSFFTEYVTLDD